MVNNIVLKLLIKLVHCVKLSVVLNILFRCLIMKKHSAFTFIEILVAITVFAIGVLAVLRLITQNLVTLDHTQDRTAATFLAKE